MSAFLRCSEATALGVHAVIQLAREGGRVVSAGELARRFRASEFHMIKVCQRLARAGFLAVRRGPQGGFSLARDPEKIRLFDLYVLFEGPVELRRCLLQNQGCTDDPEGECLVGSRIYEFEERFMRYLQSTTIASLARSRRRKVAS